MRCAVLGSPIAHSLSPVLHRAAYAELGLDWSYDAIEVRPAELPAFLDELDASWRGLSLTMPLKRTVLPLLDEADHWAETSGAANTVVLEAGRRLGANTDIPGAVAAIRTQLARVDSAVVLGGGATATSVLLALGELGCPSARLLVREPARAEETVAVVGAAPGAPRVTVDRLGSVADLSGGLGEALLVSTIPAVAQDAAIRAAAASARAVFEVVYDPWPTPVATAAAAAGRPVVTGLDLLVEQAALQVRLMTGVPEVPVRAMRVAGEQALAARSR